MTTERWQESEECNNKGKLIEETIEVFSSNTTITTKVFKNARENGNEIVEVTVDTGDMSFSKVLLNVINI